MPMLSPQLASRAGPGQGPWEIFNRQNSEGATPPSSALPQDEDILPPLTKTRTASLGCLTNTAFRPFENTRPAASLFVQNIPRDITQRELHLMFTFAQDYVSSELVREPGRTCAVVKFRSTGGATAAQAVLEHKSDLFGDQSSGWLKCDLRPLTASSSGVSTPTSATAGPASSAGNPGNPKSRFLFMNDESAVGTPIPQQTSENSSSASAFLPSSPLYSSSATSSRLFDSFSMPRRPSNGHAASAAEQRPGPPPRRASVPTRPIAELSLQTSVAPSASVLTPPSSTPSSAIASEYDHGSKVVVPFGPGTSKAKAVSIMQSGGRVMPPANPADQNPPCNTLYVGNLPPDTQEEELKDLFSARLGYKRLCFRTKANGPMCFVEFEDEVFAGKALEDLYGFGLSNSVKGGIRLSFSKNPLGVRSRQPQKYFN